MDERLLTRLDEIEQRHDQLEALMAEPEATSDYKHMTELARERSDLAPLVEIYRRYKDTARHISEAQELRDSPEPEMSQMAREELEHLEPEQEQNLDEIKRMMFPKDPNDDKNVIIEVRAGVGGDEAALFAMELYGMYARNAEKHGWKTEILSNNANDIGGTKEIIFEVSGKGAYSHFKYESGAHRVQRVPVTESQGRIHTSTATVLVMPEAEEVDFEIREEDIRTDVYRASGHGGQGVNRTDSAVRLTHVPTGIVVTCQDERSQLKNKIQAMKVLRSRLYEIELEKRQQELGEERRSQVGTGDRAEKIRTYNFPDDRVTDHRVRMTVSNVPRVLEGEIDNIIEALRMAGESESAA